MFKGINAIEFTRRFSKNEDCFDYLVAWKWRNGYSCSRCGCQRSIKGKTRFHRRCHQCRYDESVTANTIFHGMKMPILKAFHIMFRLTVKKKGMSTTELGAEVSVQQKTAWLFKRKIQVAMQQDYNTAKLKGEVQADETMLGFHTDRKHGGRNLEKRLALMVGAEILPDGRTGNLRMQQIEDFRKLTLKYALKNMINDSASIRTDDYRNYRHLMAEMPNLKPSPGKKGKSLEEIHRQIMQFKNWLVGIHHKWSKNHLFAYCDEYVFRFNRRNNRKNIFNSVIDKMMHQVPHPYPVIRTLCAHST